MHRVSHGIVGDSPWRILRSTVRLGYVSAAQSLVDQAGQGSCQPLCGFAAPSGACHSSSEGAVLGGLEELQVAQSLVGCCLYHRTMILGRPLTMFGDVVKCERAFKKTNIHKSTHELDAAVIMEASHSRGFPVVQGDTSLRRMQQSGIFQIAS
jgi:hypothetical protein